MAQYNPALTSSIFDAPLPNPPQNPSQQPWVTRGNIGGVAFDIEFNDTVLSTKGWNNPRYDGSKLSTKVINEYNNDDITLGKSVGIQQYTRNLYLGTVITDLDNSNDPNLADFPGMSYLGIGGIATINVDNELENNEFYGTPDYVKTGVYRSFFDDFPIGKNLSIKLLDQTVPNFLQDSYNVYFNEGRLRDQFTVTNSSNTGVDTTASPKPLFKYANSAASDSDALGMTVTLNSNTSNIWSTASVAPTTHGGLDDLFGELFAYKNQDYTDRDRSIFVTLKNGTNFLDFDFNFLNRRAHKTFELSRLGGINIGRTITINPKFGIKGSSGDFDGITNTSRSYVVSLLDTSNPSLLVKLSANDLPSGFGDIPFLIVPHNLHPFIKDNLEFFALQMGVGFNPNNRIELKTRNFNLR